MAKTDQVIRALGLATAAFASVPGAVQPAKGNPRRRVSIGCQRINNGDADINNRIGAGATTILNLPFNNGDSISVQIINALNSLATVGANNIFSGNTGNQSASLDITSRDTYTIQSDVISGAGGGSIIWNCTPATTLPNIQTKTINSTVLTPDGATILLGGLLTVREQRQLDRVPVLNKIPYINRLFRNVGIGRQTQELQVMVAPRIIVQEEYAPDYSNYAYNLTSDQLLAQLDRRRYDATKKALEDIKGIAPVDALIDAYEPPLNPAPLWHFWVDGRVGQSERGSDSAVMKSDIGEVTTGAYYTNFTQQSATGGYLSFREVDAEIPGAASVDGDAWGGALFHARPIGDRLFGKLLAYFEVGDAGTTIGGATGSFDFSKWQIEGEIVGHRDYGTWWIQPRANLFYALTETDAFTLSDGTAVPGGETDTLRLSFGPTFGFPHLTGGSVGLVTPFVAIEGEWDIIDGPDVVAPSGTIISNDPFNFRLTGGVNSDFAGLGTASVEASVYGGGGGDDEGHEFKGTLNIPLN